MTKLRGLTDLTVRLGALLLGAALIGYAISLTMRYYGERAFVEVPWRWSPTADMTPVDTELYHYRNGSGDSSDYVISGRPLRLRFPAAYYGYSENQQGGPQGSVMIWLDRRSYRPLAKVIFDERLAPGATKRIPESRDWPEDLPTYYHRLYRGRDLQASLDSEYLHRKSMRHQLNGGTEGYQWVLAGNMCNMPAYLIKNDLARFEAEAPSRDDIFKHREFAAFGPEESPPVSIHCAKDAKMCDVRFDFMGLEASLIEPREDVCRYKPDLLAFRSILERHVVR